MDVLSSQIQLRPGELDRSVGPLLGPVHRLPRRHRDLHWRPGAGPGRGAVTRRLCTIAGSRKYAVEELLDHSPAAYVRRPRVDYESHAVGLDRNKLVRRYLISFDAHAMNHIPGEEMPAVGKAAHAVVREAVDAGVWVFGGGLENQRASIVATDGRVTGGPYPEAVGGFAIVDVLSPEEALAWAAKFALACRCAQEVRELMPDPEQDAMLRPADRRR